MKAKSHGKEHSKKAYLTKRMFVSSGARAIREAASRAIEIQGFLILAKDGWIVKKHEDGHIEKLIQLEEIQRPTEIVLD